MPVTTEYLGLFKPWGLRYYGGETTIGPALRGSRVPSAAFKALFPGGVSWREVQGILGLFPYTLSTCPGLASDFAQRDSQLLSHDSINRIQMQNGVMYGIKQKLWSDK